MPPSPQRGWRNATATIAAPIHCQLAGGFTTSAYFREERGRERERERGGEIKSFAKRREREREREREGMVKSFAKRRERERRDGKKLCEEGEREREREEERLYFPRCFACRDDD